MSKEALEKQICDSIDNLMKLAEIYCRNQLSSNYSFILSDSNEFKGESFFELRKSSFEADYFEKIKNNPPMFHSKISMPRYGKDGKKIDVNWHFGSFNNWWKTFAYRSNYKINRHIKRKLLKHNR